MNKAYWIVGILLAGTILGWWASTPGYATEPVYGTSTLDSTTNAIANSITAPNFYGGQFHGDGANLMNVPAASSALTFFLTNTLSSDLGGSSYRTLTEDVSELGNDKYLTNTVTGSSLMIYNAVSKVGEPSVSFLSGGVYNLHVHAYKSTSLKEVAIYYKLGYYDGATVTYLGTSSSSYLTDEEASYSLPVAISDTVLSVNDRIVLSMFVSVSGVGVNPNVILEVEGNSLSHIEIAVPIASLTTIRAKNFALTPYNAGTVSNSYTVDFSNGGLQTMTLTNTVATRFTFVNTVDGALYSLVLTQPALANATVYWPSTVKWKSGTAPTITNSNGARDIIQLISLNSSVILGSHVADMK